ncbi:MAG TPA: hypothetical protein VNZ27_04950 [Rhodanobacter sp.]|jgi:hypothetical protein|nr:hypothetical protein [Rhodanobacter sp.]
MLEVRSEPDGFTVYDADASEPIIKFASRAEADELNTEVKRRRSRPP